METTGEFNVIFNYFPFIFIKEINIMRNNKRRRKKFRRTVYEKNHRLSEIFKLLNCRKQIRNKGFKDKETKSPKRKHKKTCAFNLVLAEFMKN